MLRTIEEAQAIFDYHKPDKDQQNRIEVARESYKKLVASLFHNVQDSPDKTVWLRKLHESMMTYNKAIVLENEAT
jgi:hypothetical protein